MHTGASAELLYVRKPVSHTSDVFECRYIHIDSLASGLSIYLREHLEGKPLYAHMHEVFPSVGRVAASILTVQKVAHVCAIDRNTA